MEANRILKRQILTELIALTILCFAIIYTFISLNKNDNNKISNTNGVVKILDDSKLKNIKIMSDGEGANTDGVTYAITNNNKKKISYELIIEPSTHNVEGLRILLDNLYIINLEDLIGEDNKYVLSMNELNPGYTQIHSIKIWYRKDINIKDINKNITFKYDINLQ